MRTLTRLASALAATTLTFAAPAIVTPSAHADGGYIEGVGDDPVTAAPDVTRPDTRHCTVSLADHFLSNAADGSPQSFSGTLTPPPDCKGPWSKVVLDFTSSVSGRQYDRDGHISVGGATIWYGTTAEPGGATPTTFHFAKDVTRYSALFRQPEPFSGGIGNYTSDVYTGNYDQTATLTFYMADARHPAPHVPDKVVGVPVPDLSPGSSSADVALPTLPRNLTAASLEVTLKGNGCDEQWFAGVPDSVATAMPGVCAAGPYREAAFGLDGTPVGAVGTYPHIYSGGIVPTLWRPVLGIGTLDMRPESLDLTPFVGNLVDGGTHTLNVNMPRLNDRWGVTATLFLDTDHHRARTSGAVVSAKVQGAPTIAEHSHATGNSDEQAYDATGTRNDTATGYVDTSAGRIYTTTTYGRRLSQTGTISDGGFVQAVDQTDRVDQSSVSRVGKDGRIVRSSALHETYPLSFSYSAASYVDDNNYSLEGTVDMRQQVSSRVVDGGAPVVRGWDWDVDSYGIQARSGGTTSAKDGHSTSHYVGTDDLGRHHDKLITTEHGLVTSTVGE
ncbi:MAG: hypothetical protein J2O46_02390 [Nocardioides sp.]|nr:hypothetical protein [Nocardioides sp.]